MNNYNQLISKLDKFIRKYYLNQFIRGSLYSIGLVVALFLIFNLLESQFYFSTSVRKTFFFSFILVSFAAIGYWIIFPLSKYFGLGKSINHEQAAKIVGSHFTDVKDKLLNILQLKKEVDSNQSELLKASIQQKTESIKLVPFKSAINLKDNRKYVKYALPPLMLLIGILFINANLITDSTKRIIDNDTVYIPDAPFELKVLNGDESVIQYKDHTIEVIAEGDKLPNEVFVEIDNFKYRLKKNSPSNYSYTFRNLIKDTSFKVSSGRVVTEDHEIKVLKKPQLASFDVKLNYPKYTKRKTETLKNIGDFSISEGTKVSWFLNAQHVNDVQLRFGDKIIDAEKNNEDAFTYSSRLRKSQPYSIYLKNKHVPTDSTSYQINVIKDGYPTIDVKEFSNEGEEVKYYAGTADDDYGIASLVMKYSVTHQDGSTEPEKSVNIERENSARVQFKHTVDFTDFDLKSGDKLSYYFEVGDNDAINGSKKTKSSVKTFEKASLEKLEEMEDINDEEIKNSLEDSLENMEEIREQYEKMRQELMQKKEIDWKDRQKMQQLLEEQEQIREQLKEAQEKLEENIENQEAQPKDEEIQEKQEKMQELFEKALDPEKEELMEKVQELMEELEKENSLEQMEQMDMQNEMLQKDMKRLLELYKQLDVEKDAKDLIQKMEKLADQQMKLAEEDSKKSDKAEKQKSLNEEMKKLQKKMDELQKKNDELKRPKKMDKDAKKEMDKAAEKMDEAEKELNSESKSADGKSSGSGSGDSGGEQKQKEAAKMLKKTAKAMAISIEGEEEEKESEDAELLRQILENLLTISFDQEDISTDVNQVRMLSPRYKEIVFTQSKLKDDFKIVEDSLVALANRNDKIETFVLDKVSEAKFHIQKSIENLKERDTKRNAYKNQRFTMKNLNDLALMLAKSLDSMSGGGGSGSKSSQSPSGSKPSDKLSKMGQQLGEQLGGMMDGQGGSGGNSAKEFAEAAAKMAAMRRALEKMRKGRRENGEGENGELNSLIEDMNRMEIDLVNKRLDKRMIDRQQDIQTRLLQAEKAQNKRGYDNKREGRKPKTTPRKNPPSLDDYLKKRASEVELYKTISPELRPYYKELVEKYYQALRK